MVKEKILESEQTKRVSMPSTLFVDAGTDAVLGAVRVGRVKLLRAATGLLAVRGEGASWRCWGEAGRDMAGQLCEHFGPKEAAVRIVYYTGKRPAPGSRDSTCAQQESCAC